MKKVIILTIATGICLSANATDPKPASQPVPAQGEALYLHCFRATLGMKVQPSLDKTPATPPARLLSIKLTLGKEFDLQVGEHHHGLKGTIFKDELGLRGKLDGSFGMSYHTFEGRIVEEKPFDPELLGFFSGASPFRCVVSRKRNITPFLEAQKKVDAERLAKATRKTYER